MRNRTMSYGTAAMFSLGISLVMHLMFMIMSLYGRDVMIPPERQQDLPMFHWTHIIVSFVSNFILTFVLYVVNFKVLKMRYKDSTKLALVIATSLVVAVALSYLLTKADMALYNPWKNPVKAIKGGIARDLFLAIIVIFSSQLLYLNQRRNQMAVEFEALKSENVMTKYQVLKNQMDPHFLFNSLNTLNSMIAVDPAKAQEYVQQLSSVLRYTLHSQEVNTLDEELKFTEAYCSLMQIRYGDSLNFVVEIDPRYMQCKIIPLSIQAMVENAIKHNVVSNKYPLTVTIRTVGDEPAIIVSNPIQPKKETPVGSGIGLANLSERVRLKWQKELEIDNSGGAFTVKIPLIMP